MRIAFFLMIAGHYPPVVIGILSKTVELIGKYDIINKHQYTIDSNGQRLNNVTEVNRR